jgi:hypothetical protein
MATVYLGTWSAVSWHRFILLREKPDLLSGKTALLVWSYFGWALALILIMIVVAIPLQMITGWALTIIDTNRQNIGPAFVGLAVVLFASVVYIWFWLRVAIVLPARAIDRVLGVGDAWTESGRHSRAIFNASFLLVLLHVGGATALFYFAGASAQPTLELVAQVFNGMVGLSLLTTLHGLIIGEPIRSRTSVYALPDGR